jgi:hypothetical protein
MTNSDHSHLLASGFEVSCDPDDLCSKCQQPAIPHVILVHCGHSFCEPCANAVKECSVCGKEITLRFLYGKETERIRQSLRYVCKALVHVARGCTFVGSVEEAKLHRGPCPVTVPVVLEIRAGSREDDFSLFALLSDTILSVKKQLQALTGRPPAAMALTFRDKEMRDETVLAEHYARHPLSFSLHWNLAPPYACGSANSSPCEPCKEADDRILEINRAALDADDIVKTTPPRPCAGAV